MSIGTAARDALGSFDQIRPTASTACARTLKSVSGTLDELDERIHRLSSPELAEGSDR